MSQHRTHVREATEARILAATDKLFRERGFDSTTVRDIAAASGVSVGRVMAVGDKNTLLVQVFDDLIREAHAPLGDPPGSPGPTCEVRVVSLVRPFVALFLHRAELARAYASILASGAHSSALFNELSTLLRQQIAASLEASGCSAPEQATVTADALYFAYVGCLFSWSASDAPDEAEALEALEVVFGAICNCKENKQ